MIEPSIIQPPKAAAWLLDLFAPPNRSDSIQGDLSEEFQLVAVNRGPESARLWYWRQVGPAILHLVGGQLRREPFRILALVIGGLVLLNLAFRGYSTLNQAVLARFDGQIYSIVDAPTFWIYCRAIQRAIVPLAVGWLIAWSARGREMPVVILVALISRMPYLVGSLMVVMRAGMLHAWNPNKLVIVLPLVTLIAGGVIRCKMADHAPRREERTA